MSSQADVDLTPREVATKAGPITVAIILVIAVLEAFLFMSGQSGW